MGLEPTTLRDLVGCSNHWATGDSMVSEGQFVGLDWNRIARLHSQVLVSTCENSLTASRCHIKAYQDAANQPPKWAYKDETNFLIEKSEPQMGLEPTTLRDLVGCSNHWATGDSMVSEGQFVGLDWNRIARLHSQVLVSTLSLIDHKT